MLIRKNLHLHQIIRITWKVDLVMLALCFIAYYVDTKLIPDIDISPSLPALMGTAIAFFIGFNNNQAYDRWWEARTIWGGLVNDSRSWARSLVAFASNTTGKDKSCLREMVLRHIAFLRVLRSSLRGSDDKDYLQYLSGDEARSISGIMNKGNAILDIQAFALEKMKRDSVIDNFQFFALHDLLRGFCDGMGKSERIQNTVFPTTYIYFTRLFIWLFVVMLTMSLSVSVGVSSVFFGWIMGFIFHITHINGMSIMNPFEEEPTGVPISSITRTIEINLLQTLGERDLPEPVKPVNGEYIM